MRGRIRRARGFTLVELLTVLCIMTMIAAIIMPRFFIARDTSAYTACGQNLRNIATALQSYANDNDQQYPPLLNALTPQYMALLPACPDAKGTDSYSPSYEASANPRTFTVFCNGSYHTTVVGVLANQPYYYMGVGLGPDR